MSQQKLPPEVQQTLAQYQALKESFARIDAELRLVESELTEIESILDTLKPMDDNAEVYKLVGHILVKKTKKDVVAELEERKELLGIKKEKYKNQLKILEKQINDLEKKLQDLMGKYGIKFA